MATTDAQAIEYDDPIAVDENMVVTADSGDRPAHRQMRGVVDVEAIDLGDRGCSHPDGNRPRADERGESVALGHR